MIKNSILVNLIIFFLLLAGIMAGSISTDSPYPDIDYKEKYRPQFHFTSGKNWINDPNGMVYYKGEYHLFFQHNPKGKKWGNMTWGHAVSKDMVLWKQLAHAILPDDKGTIFSGSAAVDVNNTAGWQKGDEKTLVAAFTYAGSFGDPPAPFSQAIAYSTDKGRRMAKFENNPVIENQGLHESERDPKIFWHEPTKKWIMVVYMNKGTARFFNSDDLKEWTKTSDYKQKGFYECPDLVELPVDNDPNNKKWVIYDAGFKYAVGSFDGRVFTRESGPFKGEMGANFYAAQTFNNSPDKRCIQIGWMRGSDFIRKRMVFNQQMSFPCELTLRSTAEGIRLFRWPVKEIETLYTKSHKMKNVTVNPGDNPLKNIHAKLLDISMTISTADAKKILFDLRGVKFTYSTDTGRLRLGLIRYKSKKKGAQKKAETYKKSHILKPVDGKIKLRILLDRGSIEIFGNDGALSSSNFVLPDPENKDLSITVEDGSVNIDSLIANELKSAWE